ncbi:uncharacterized protein KGF55_003563 [Candida pseudojiufengensis]|uniref:uncharacterized protein n=1 Tax=Candida pseudojiufengensis TaxID=497109 RepID=UPI002224A536|nr:uncharacterized protein KGF55_003563 [Candida pseudojiufengensis]KAI5962487.1 hypothetical protein KGF55_003563 [Candida pseudojiufengensis]
MKSKNLVNKVSPSTYEADLDKQLKMYKLKKDTLIKVTKYIKEKDQLQESISYWRNVAQKALNYLYNEQSVQFAKIGGFKNWHLQQWESKQRALELQQDEMIMNLQDTLDSATDDAKESFIEQLQESGFNIEDGEIINNYEEQTPPNFNDEFSIQELCKILNIDYNLIYSI